MASSFIARVVTIGRKSKKEHEVLLRLVYYNNRYYASRRNINSDWLKNMLANGYAKILLDDKVIECKARLVNDDRLSMIISRLKYGDDTKRVIIELEPI